MNGSENLAQTPDLLTKVPKLVLIERVLDYLSLREVNQLAGTCLRLHRLIRSGLCAELLCRRRAMDEVAWTKAFVLDRVRVMIVEKQRLPLATEETRPPESLMSFPQAATGTKHLGLESRLLRAKEAELEELRKTVSSQKIQLKVLAEEVTRLRKEVATLAGAKDRYEEQIEAISRAIKS